MSNKVYYSNTTYTIGNKWYIEKYYDTTILYIELKKGVWPFNTTIFGNADYIYEINDCSN